MCSETKQGCTNLATKKKVHDIAIFDDVLLAFAAHFAGVFGALLAFEGDVVGKRDEIGRAHV